MSYTQQVKSIIAAIIVMMVIGVVAISQTGLVFAESSEDAKAEITHVQQIDTIKVGETAKINVTVKNTGTATFDSNVNVKVMLYVDKHWICSERLDGLEPGQEGAVELEYIPTEAGSFEYKTRVKEIFSDGSKIILAESGTYFFVAESKESKAEITYVQQINNIKVGETANIKVTVKNTGTATFDSNVNVKVMLYVDGHWICSERLDGLEPGQEGTVELEYIPAEAGSFEYKTRVKEIFSNGSKIILAESGTYFFVAEYRDANAEASVSVSSSPSGADIYLDGVYKGTTPTTISYVSPGSHTLKLEKYGYEEWLTSVDVEPGVTESITAQLTPADISPPAISIQSPIIIEQNNNELLEEGEKVTITYGATDPSGVISIKILLDGTMLESQNRAGTYTATTNSLPVGKHIIRIEATDSKSNSGFEELLLTVERTGPSVYFGTTRTTINKGEDAIFTLSAVNPLGNPSMTVQLILKPPSGVSVTSSSFAKAGSGIYTCTQTIESGDNLRSIEVHLTGNQIGTHEIASEVYYQFEGSPKSPTRYETLTLIVESVSAPTPIPTITEDEKKTPGFGSPYVLLMLLFVWYYRIGGI